MNNLNDFDIVSLNGTNYILRILQDESGIRYALYTMEGELFNENIDSKLLSFVATYEDFYKKLNESSTKKSSKSHHSSSSGSSSSGGVKNYNTNNIRDAKDSSKNEASANELSEAIGTVDKTEETLKNCATAINDAKNAIQAANVTLNTWDDVKNAQGLATDASVAFLSNMVESLNTIESNLENNLEAANALHKLNISLKQLLIKYVEKKEKEKQRDDKKTAYDNEPEYKEQTDSNGNVIQVHNDRKDQLKQELDKIIEELSKIEEEIDTLQNDIDYQYKIIKDKYGNLINFGSMFGTSNTIFGTAGVRHSSEKEVELVDGYTFTQMEYQGLHYWLYLPEGVEYSEDLPVMIYMHGASEYGKEIASNGLAGQLKRHHFGFNPNAIIICPQVDYSWNTNNKGFAKLKAITDSVVQEYNADPSRISVSGHSAGALNAMKIAAAYPDYFSAVVAVSEGKPDTLDTPGLDGVKYWGICGSQDKYLKNLEASAEKGTVDFNLTVLEGQGHEIEDIVFNNEYDLNGEMQNPLIWALSQSRSS